ncbi:hypothetical protein [Fibrella arboris]|uniref:hypothetical protein n=1 Tax=Fibrella arboris TaxID=3242486 RepID=UPI00352089E9
MKQFIHSLTLSLAGAALLTACSRPVATFQKSQPERFYSQQKATEPALVADDAAPVIADVSTTAAAEVAAVSPPVTAQTKQASDALVSLKAANSTDRRLTKRIEKAERMLAQVNLTSVAQPVATTKKASFMERTMLKSIDKKIKKHMAPKETTAMTGYVRLGAIIGLIGLLLLLIGNGVGATIGLIALIAGLVLILLGVINQA